MTAEIADKESRLAYMQDAVKTLRENGTQITEFSEDRWCALVDFATVYSKDNIVFTFRVGKEIKA